MTSTEKAKEAFNEIINQDTGTWDKPVSFGVLHTRSVDIARDALSALEAEKPAEELEEVAEKIMEASTYWMRSSLTMAESQDEVRDMIQQYAEAYHAKKCAESKSNEAQR